MSLTRFRAYQLGIAGSSFSYSHNGDFTLIEARLTDLSAANIDDEINDIGGGTLNVLHITSWDKDHCDPTDLGTILKVLDPPVVQAPGYAPTSDSGKLAVKMLQARKKSGGTVQFIGPNYIGGLSNASALKTSNILLWPRELHATNHNDNSVAKFFRSGHFTVLSLGDIESADIADQITAGSIVTDEVDILILPHHGADNGFTSKEFLEAVSPRSAICSSNYDSQYEHPKQSIRDLLYEQDIRLFTTKTGDVIIESDGTNGEFHIYNTIGNSTKLSSAWVGKSKHPLQ